MDRRCLLHAVPWSLDICSNQRSPVHRKQTHGASNRDTQWYPPHNILSVYLTTTAYVRRSGRITSGMRSGRTASQDSAFSVPTPAPTHPEWPSQEQRRSGLTASAPVSDVSAPACTNGLGVWHPLRSVSVAQKNKPSTMSSSNVQSTDLLTDCTAWRFWTMRQLKNGCSTPAPRSSATKQWFQQISQKKKIKQTHILQPHHQ